ncbi:hypothetical protein P3H15_32475 [Rhodococcus sp. T2V]|uniref:hypothetical protein n=1 Tax=Rhodococcus sp. T2V TaxID=3034164 RepID=UPI0023E2F564|nr:hypothetical protein [Rhodococcus sp. T2V]MDF3309735.1 hypothetical protein [Rhodococcus sp. T2V]
MRFTIGDRVVFTAPDRAVVNESGTVTRTYAVSRPIIEVDLDNGQHWLCQPQDLRRS